MDEPPTVIDIDDPAFTGGELLGEKDYEALLAEGDPADAYQTPADEWQAISLCYTSGTGPRARSWAGPGRVAEADGLPLVRRRLVGVRRIALGEQRLVVLLPEQLTPGERRIVDVYDRRRFVHPRARGWTNRRRS